MAIIDNNNVLNHFLFVMAFLFNTFQIPFHVEHFISKHRFLYIYYYFDIQTFSKSQHVF